MRNLVNVVKLFFEMNSGLRVCLEMSQREYQVKCA
jgi:hypothetical protein